MIFNSVTYLVFLTMVVATYWILPRRGRLWLLFSASIVFYGFWSFTFVPLMIISVGIDYSASLLIEMLQKKSKRKIVLCAAVGMNLTLLVFFKYYYFLGGNLIGFASIIGFDVQLPNIEILLPIGISFYTFQSISYTVDVYRGQIRASRDFLLFANYVMFFPQLIAGPILRASEVVWQLNKRPSLFTTNIACGLRRILCGLFLKVVLADNLAPIVDDLYRQEPKDLGAIDTLTMSFMFGFQIYFDFAAYSQIAIGSAKLMGIDLPENFNFPYLASSPRSFWRRWHISLSSWIRDYVYLPLLGVKVEDRSSGGIRLQSVPSNKSFVTASALFLTWSIMGLWHGAAWAFIVWGLYHATILLGYRFLAPGLVGVPIFLRSFLGWIATLPLIMLSWIPFRSQSIEISVELWGNLFSVDRWSVLGFRENVYLVALLVLLLILLAPLAGAMQRKLRRTSTCIAAITEGVGYTIASMLIIIYLRPVEQFIYFQF